MTAIQQTDSTAENAFVPVETQGQARAVRHDLPRHAAAPADSTEAKAEETHAAVEADSVAATPSRDVPGAEVVASWWCADSSWAAADFTKPYFLNDSLYASCAADERYGVVGDPVPYTVRNDNTITALLVCCFVVAMLAFTSSRRFFARQVKHFFREPNRDTAGMSETTAETRCQLFFVLQTCLLLSIIAFLYVLECVAGTFVLHSQYRLMGLFFGVFAVYFVLKMLLYRVVNGVFFGRKKSVRWLKSLVFAVSVEGILLYPLVLLQSYFDLSVQKAVIYVFFVIALVKMLLLYKSFVMFFKQKPFCLQIILYFCALEIMPLLSLWGVLVKVVDYLKINI